MAVEGISERDTRCSRELGRIPKKLEPHVEKGGIEVSMGLLQTVALLGTARILRRVSGEDVAV